MSKLIWGSIAGSARNSKAPRRRAVKLADTGKVYEPTHRASGMHKEVTDPKVIATFLSAAELRAQLEAEQDPADA